MEANRWCGVFLAAPVQCIVDYMWWMQDEPSQRTADTTSMTTPSAFRNQHAQCIIKNSLHMDKMWKYVRNLCRFILQKKKLKKKKRTWNISNEKHDIFNNNTKDMFCWKENYWCLLLKLYTCKIYIHIHIYKILTVKLINYYASIFFHVYSFNNVTTTFNKTCLYYIKCFTHHYIAYWKCLY